MKVELEKQSYVEFSFEKSSLLKDKDIVTEMWISGVTDDLGSVMVCLTNNDLIKLREVIDKIIMK